MWKASTPMCHAPLPTHTVDGVSGLTTYSIKYPCGTATTNSQTNGGDVADTFACKGSTPDVYYFSAGPSDGTLIPSTAAQLPLVPPSSPAQLQTGSPMGASCDVINFPLFMPLVDSLRSARGGELLQVERKNFQAHLSSPTPRPPCLQRAVGYLGGRAIEPVEGE
jgi:hypothetical protein